MRPFQAPLSRARSTDSSWALKIGSASDTAAGISVVIQARLTLMPESCSLTCWRYKGWWQASQDDAVAKVDADAGA
ncbi:hypothetical protein [Massilia scottii]|uniref:hypothetical protein n=1 Tax=Massilia scottii TaxID=3057166 RepID=UPI002796A4AF|nr:hypothetical protein [Massilia sp. CCM 9029]MDQ1829379.1 hypothetical protein [Massilia sp. CCM 9029]